MRTFRKKVLHTGSNRQKMHHSEATNQYTSNILTFRLMTQQVVPMSQQHSQGDFDKYRPIPNVD